jgi:hypothetical protein
MIEQAYRRGAVAGLGRLIEAQMLQDLLNDVRIFNRSDDAYQSTTLLALIDRAAFGSMAKTRLSRCAQLTA